MTKAQLEQTVRDLRRDRQELESDIRELLRDKSKLELISSDKQDQINNLNRKYAGLLSELTDLTYTIHVRCRNCSIQGNLRVAKGRHVDQARCANCQCKTLKTVK